MDLELMSFAIFSASKTFQGLHRFRKNFCTIFFFWDRRINVIFAHNVALTCVRRFERIIQNVYEVYVFVNVIHIFKYMHDILIDV